MCVVKGGLARRKIVDIEAGKRDAPVRNRVPVAGNIETQISWPGRRGTRGFGRSLNEVGLERVVIVGLVGLHYEGGRWGECGQQDDARMSRHWRWLNSCIATSRQAEQEHT